MNTVLGLSTRTFSLWLACMALTSIPQAFAVDGVIEINQARALAGGVTPGDAAGFPVTIDQPGSYRLTSNLDVRQQATPENVTAIKIEVDDVSIDLNGFSIFGPTNCDINPFSCAPTGTGRGIDGENKSRLSVVNGRVIGMGSHGVILGSRSRIKEMIAIENGGDGLQAGFSSTMTGCIADQNGGSGILIATNSVISGNTANYNGGEAGIFAGPYSLVLNNTASYNQNKGIRTQDRSSVIGNTVSSNDDEGLSLGALTGYVNNVVNSNNPDIDGGVQMGTNICGGDTTCP